MKELLNGKNVLFITTKNLDYLRNVQELRIIRDSARSVEVLGYKDKSYIVRLLKIYFRLLFMSVKTYDLVFIGFAPQLIVPFFNFKLRGKTVIMDFFISVYDTMVNDRKKFKSTGLAGKFCKWLDKHCIKRAELVVSDTKAHGAYFAKEFGVNPDRIEVVYLEADTSIYHNMEIERPEYLKGKFVVLYFGSILPLQGVEIVNKAIDLLKDNKDLFFYVIGPIKDESEKVISDNVKYISWLSQQKLAEHIAYSNLCLAGHFNKDIDKAKRTIPGKAYIYEAMGKAMILGDNPANRELHTEGDKKYFVKMGDAKALADKILQIKESGNLT